MTLQTTTFSDFTGGLDLVTSLPQIADNATPDAINWTIKEDGSLEKIRGWRDFWDVGQDISGIFNFDNDGDYAVNPLNGLGTPYYSTGPRAGFVTFPYTITERRSVFVTAGSDILRFDGEAAPTTLAADPANPGAPIAPAVPVNSSALQFNYYMLFLDDVNQMRVTPGEPDGAGGANPDYDTYEWHPWTGNGTATQPQLGDVDTDSAGPPTGRLLAVWNRTAYMRPTSAPNVLKWCSPDNPFNWPGNFENTFSSPDTGGEILAAIPTPGALLVLATDAVYRVYDQFSGAYTVLSRDGVTSPNSVREIDGIVYYMSRRGIMATDGNAPPQLVSRAVDPLLISRSSDLSRATAFRRDGRYYCSFERTQARTGLATANVIGDNNLTIEVMPQLGGAIMAHGLPMELATETRMLNQSVVDILFVDPRFPQRLRLAFNGGDDAGSPILALYTAAPTDFGSQEFVKRIRRTRLVGRGQLAINCVINYTGDIRYLLSPTGDGAVDTPDGLGDLVLPFGAGDDWDIADWDVGVWGDWVLSEGWSRLNRRGREFSYVFVSNLPGDAAGRPILGGGGEPSNGVTLQVYEPHFSTADIRRRL